jgi:hypothetical protein
MLEIEDRIPPLSVSSVEALAGVKIKQVGCGYDHCAVLCTGDGEVYTR